MRTYHDCLSCFIDQALATARRAGADEAGEERVMRTVLEILRHEDFGHPPPRIAGRIYPAIAACLGQRDPYAEIKRASNRELLALLPRLRERIAAAPDPFRATVKLALAGNVIDFGVPGPFDLETSIERLLAEEPVVDQYEILRRELQGARRVLYLADNAGEIVLDRLLVEEIAPGREVTLAVRGGPTLNDVTRADVEQVGLEQVVTVVEPEVTLPGIWLEGSGPALRRSFDEAELIISKGQGNFETLHAVAVSAPLFFLFMVKCPMVARHTGRREGDALVALAGRVGEPA